VAVGSGVGGAEIAAGGSGAVVASVVAVGSAIMVATLLVRAWKVSAKFAVAVATGWMGAVVDVGGGWVGWTTITIGVLVGKRPAVGAGWPATVGVSVAGEIHAANC